MDALKTYIKSLKAANSKNMKEAESLLCQSLDIKELTPYMKENLDKLTDIDNPNDIMLILTTAKKKEK